MSYDQERAHTLKSRHSTEESSSTKQAHPSVGMLLHMQRTAGNAAVNALLSGRSARGTAVQRAAAVEEGEADTNIGERIRAASGKGSSLGGDVQRTLESGLGASMAGVNVHTDSEADHLAKSVDSVAFTTGSDIFFRSGAYNPGTSEGMHLLAHEATHTVQQAQGPVSGTPSAGGVSISDPSDSYEQAAEASAARVTSGAAPVQSMAAGSASAAVQREAAPEEEEVQTMRSSEYQAVQREAEGAEAEEEEVQAMRSSEYQNVQREAEGAEEEDEQMQAMRSSEYQNVQREAEGAEAEEEEVQAMRSSQYAAVQRHSAEEEG